MRLIREQIYRIVFYQFVVVLVVVVGWYLASGMKAASSALSGGLISVLASFFFARVVIRSRVAKSPKAILLQLYLGEALKLIVTAALFMIAFALFRIEFVPLFSAYIATLCVFWPSLLLALPQNKFRKR